MRPPDAGRAGAAVTAATRSGDVTLTEVPGGVCAVPGVRASGIAAGLKPSGKPDLAVVAADGAAAAAGVQTRNQVVAAPVEVTREHLAGGRARAVLLNSGSANACTGPDGLALARRSAEVAAGALGYAPSEVLLCSTGVIGEPIPEQPFLEGIPRAVAALDPGGSAAAARAILTTDTAVKEVAVTARDAGGGACTVGGIAKGSGMIAPAMATMLCVLTTDAPVRGPVLDSALRDAVDRAFGRISVDECMSTNDAVLLLTVPLAAGGGGDGEAPAPSLAAFTSALHAVCARLAEMVVRDGEGATTLVRVRVTGARSEDDAVAVGRAVGSSVLVKTALAGGDPNWGRVLAAAGAGPVAFEPARVDVRFGGVTVCRFGVAASFDRGQAAAALRGGEVEIEVALRSGDAEATFLTCDLTHDYVRINSEYTT